MAPASDLIPGLFDDLVLDNIFPRLPWYIRPVCRAVSSSWRSIFDNALRDDHVNNLTRRFQLPLLQNATLVCLGEGNNLLEVLVDDDGDQTRRRLPAIEQLPVGRPKIVASNGMVFVWTLARGKCWSPSRDLIFKLDLGRGKWSWDCIPATRTSNWFDAIEFDGKIYSSWEYRFSPFSLRCPVKLDVIVYDMETGSCNTIEKWHISSAGVVNSGTDKSLYSLVWQDETLELMRFDSVSGRWNLREVIPRKPELLNSTLKVVSGECFEPAAGSGINVISLGHFKGDAVYWYNSAQKAWVAIEHGSEVASRNVRVVRGVLYATSEADEGSEEFWILRGKVHVANKKLVWKSVAEFDKSVIAFTRMS